MSREAPKEMDHALRERGLRPTRARRLLLAHLSESVDHPSTDEILRALRGRGYRVGTATIYQNLSKLVAMGLISRLAGPDGLMRFDANTVAHPHAVCRGCGKMVDAQISDGLVKMLEPFCPHTGRRLDDWQLDSIQVEFGGLCPLCREDSSK